MTLKKFSFNVIKSNGHARLGKIRTHRGNIDTPVFMPVGTQATIKGAFMKDIVETGSQVILCNTYHLMIRPGVNRLKKSKGLHKFMNCNLPILTDSGGYQIMSLSKLNKIDPIKGAIFNSHIDGTKYYLSPEESIKIQKKLNSDIVMVLDECPKKTLDYDVISKSVDLSTEWAKRSKKAFGNIKHKALFGIVQGGLFEELRIKSLNDLKKIGFDGYAIGGLAVGDTQNEMFKVLDYLKDKMPVKKPRYLMGVGTPSDPYVKKFDLNKYSKNYLNHLFNTNEMLGSMILTLNNINFYQELMFEIRKNIKKGTFLKFYNKYSKIL